MPEGEPTSYVLNLFDQLIAAASTRANRDGWALGDLRDAGVPILGTSADAIDLAEDRKRFQALLQELNLKQPRNGTAMTAEETVAAARTIGYPVILRPSYVLGGRGMVVVSDEAELKKQVESGELSFGHARTLLGLATPEQIAAAAQKVLALSMSVRQTETYVQGLMNPESKPAKAQKVIEPQDPNVHEAQDRLQRALGLRVHIEDKKGKGRVIVEYSGIEDFDLLLTALHALIRNGGMHKTYLALVAGS